MDDGPSAVDGDIPTAGEVSDQGGSWLDGRLPRLAEVGGGALWRPSILLLLWLIVGTIGFVVIEGWSAGDAAYMTVITISTVGYAEVNAPLSGQARLFASFLILAGLGTVFYAFTTIGQMVVEGELADMLGRRRMRRELNKLDGHYIVCGYGKTAQPVVAGLEQADEEFCVIEVDRELEDELRAEDHAYLLGDATEEEILDQAGVERAEGLLAMLPSDADNLYVTMSAKNLNPDVRVIAQASDKKAAMNLRRGGADEVVSAYEAAGNRIVQVAIKPSVVEFTELATPQDHIQLSLEDIQVDQDSHLDGSTLEQSNVDAEAGVIVVAVRKPDGRLTFNPEASEQIAPGDHLLALGEPEDLEAFERMCRAR